MTGYDEKGYWAARRGAIGEFFRSGEDPEKLARWMNGEEPS
jgi:hypothetical protein